jgi:hypothetical protein
LKTEPLLGEDGVEEADVTLNGSHPALPPIALFQQSANSGSFVFSNAIPIAGNYTVTPAKDDNPLNGVSTYDLVLISRHILGLEPLHSPYQQIAADANKSSSITTFDIVELRKLILGIYQQLPGNTSWRFVDKAFVFPNPDNAFQTTFPEQISVANALSSHMDDSFVGVKIGDVNGTAIANGLSGAVLQDRGGSADLPVRATLLFDVEDRAVKTGEAFEVTLKAAQTVAGYQFTLNTPGLEFLGTDLPAGRYGVFADALTVSQDGEGIETFTLRFRARKDGLLSEMLGMSSRITRAEAYGVPGDVPNGQTTSSRQTAVMDVALRFDGATIAGIGFELYQNEPNPFVDKTLIGFHLPSAAETTLTVYDETGRTIYTTTGDFAKGYNTIVLDRVLPADSGLLYYKLETAGHSAARKMIRVK